MRFLAFISIFFLLSGCHQAPPQLVPITGFVRLDGRPLKEGVIVFEADGQPPASGKIVNGEILEVTTHTPNDGATTGKKTVAVRSPDVAGGAGKARSASQVVRDQVIPEQYKNPSSSNLTCDITKGSNKLVFSLISEQKAPTLKKTSARTP